jgi:hypothetical protein
MATVKLFAPVSKAGSAKELGKSLCQPSAQEVCVASEARKEEEKLALLRDFDFTQKFGPFVELTRLQR